MSSSLTGGRSDSVMKSEVVMLARARTGRSSSRSARSSRGRLEMGM